MPFLYLRLALHDVTDTVLFKVVLRNAEGAVLRLQVCSF